MCAARARTPPHTAAAHTAATRRTHVRVARPGTHLLPWRPQSLLSADDLATVPFLILGNKIDMGRVASEDELRTALGLHHLTTGKGKVPLKDIRPIELFMCSVVKRSGYGEGFRWLSQYIN